MSSTKSNLASKNIASKNIASKNKKSIFKNDISQVFKLIVEKRVFFLLILINLVVQLYITYYVSKNVNIVDTNDTKKTRYNAKTIAAYIVSFILIIILALVPMPLWLKFIIFSLFSVVLGVILSSVKHNFDPNTIKGAFVGTISIFVSMFAFGLALIMSGIQLGYKFGLGLFFALLLLILISIVQIFIYNSSFLKKLIILISLILFSLYIVYDTNSILQRNYSGDFISASLDYYLDIINIFSALLGESGLSD